MTWLRDALPRDRWASLHETAAFWLQMHDGFRRQQAEMAAAVADWRMQGDTRAFHARLIPVLQSYLQHLDGHHRIESRHYFPQFRRVEPRIQGGLDLLDRDHDAVHHDLEAMLNAGRAFHGEMRAGTPDPSTSANRLADAVVSAAAPMLRHLEDEEDIVIPLIQKHGDGL